MRKSFTFFKFFLPKTVAYAHCDVPCGIYDPKPAQIAAATVLKMVQRMQELSLPDMKDQSRVDRDKKSIIEYQNAMTRLVWTKEEHARKCKEELLILWTDYFKPEHLSSFPNLHDTFWQAAKLCSKNKQTVDIESAKKLVDKVDEIAAIFEKTKTAK